MKFAEAARQVEERQGKQPVKRQINFEKKRGDEDGDSTTESEKESDSDAEESVEAQLIVIWRSFSPPVTEEDCVKNKWIAAIYREKKKPCLFIGKWQKRLLKDEDGPVSAVQTDCLKQHFRSGTILELIPEHQQKDVNVFPICDVIAGCHYKDDVGKYMNTNQ